ncbi:MAG: C10 family peptidase [Alistipes sp.]|nr:C10 family peptidase [Alistipes sp.]
MKKLSCILFAAVLLTACEQNLFEVEVAKEQPDALEAYLTRVAEEGIAMLGDVPTRSGSRRVVDPARIKAAVASSTRSGELDTLFYVVNFADSAGFALIDADTMSARPLFAVTEKGNYTPGEVTNTGFDDYIMLLENQLGNSPRIPIDTTNVGIMYSEVVEGPELIVGPLLEVEWGQDSPYNMFCYDEVTDLKSVSGCVPTAIAQIMAYHEYPSVLQLTHPYKGDLNSLVLDWGQIKYHEKNGTSIYGCWCADHTHLQHLMREIGERVQTTYYNRTDPNEGTRLEGATNETTIIPGIVDLGYDVPSTFVSYSRNVVVAELNAACPVYCQGIDFGQEKGHAWVIDGYHYQSRVLRTYQEIPGMVFPKLIREEDWGTIDMLHINWGWDGNANGYYQSGTFNGTFDDVSFNYNYNVQILTNFKPVE